MARIHINGEWVELSDHLEGTEYIKEGIAFTAERPAPFHVMMTKELYPYLARWGGTTPARVEASMRRSIKSAGVKMTNSEFIHRAAAEVRKK